MATPSFFERVWIMLACIPSGRVTTYRDIAHALGQPRAARAVARACATNPRPYPSHGVIARSPPKADDAAIPTKLTRSSGLPRARRRELAMTARREALSIVSALPCHRVVMAGGRIGGYSGGGGVHRKIVLLTAEGVRVRRGRIVDFSGCHWKPTPKRSFSVFRPHAIRSYARVS